MDEKTPFNVPEFIRPYLNEIAERLWSGHAAIMVGAGFSRNAKPNGVSCLGFPDWNQLGDLFYEKTHDDKPNNKSKYLNVLKLGDELQAAFGRPVLDQLLRDAIPDADYEPSPLHVKLLDLPWQDVFTTNYDTLLERACISVTSQKYDIVVNKEDLVYSEKPRIIKLHGSFPSERPFIITEEDYRRYPKDFAPFVNTVQQALLENTLCLIGFSGEDPNFFQWIGWIRDNLGSQNSPKIYLIGVLNLSHAQQKLLEQRNIVLVDMAGCSGVDRDHYKGLEKFFDYLLSRKGEDNRLEWPESLEFIHPNSQNDKLSELTQIIAIWKKQRESYPEWIILPEDRRHQLWICTQYWVNFISLKDDLESPLDLEFAFELHWRLEKCLVPIFNSEQEFFEAVLTKYLSFNSSTDLADSRSTKYEHLTESDLQHRDVVSMSLPLLIALMRFYREEGLLEKWKELNVKANSLIKYFSAEQKASLHYERVLYALFALDLVNIRKELTEWPVNESLPFWEAKRAGILAETGQEEEAEKILEQSLKNIRSKLNLKPIKSNYSLVSQEAFVMVLLKYIKNALRYKNHQWLEQESSAKFTERWNTLKQYKCDPWNELKLFEYCLERPPIEQSTVTEVQEFDIGRVNRINHFRSTDEEALVAYNFLRFCEDTGIPFQISTSSFAKKSAEGALLRISKYSPYWAMAIMVRIGDQKVVKHIFNRESLSRMSASFIDNLIESYLHSLEQSAGDLLAKTSTYSSNFGLVLAKVIPEVLSRLCTKCSLKSKYRLIDFLIGIYKSPYKHSYNGIRNLMERLLGSFSVHQRYDLITNLLDFPVLDNLNPIDESEFINPFRFLKLDKKFIRNKSKPVIPEEKINYLFDKALSDNPNARTWAIFSLVQLYDLELLEQEQQEKLANILWCKLDDFGLPSETSYYKFAFLNLPHPTSVDPTSLLKNYIFSKQFPVQKKSIEQGIGITGGEIPIYREIIGANRYIHWTDEEVKEIFNRLVEWWEADKDYLKKKTPGLPFGSIIDEFRARFTKLIDICTEVIGPNFNQNTETVQKETLQRLIGEFHEYGLPTLRLEFACLHLFPERKTELFGKIENGLASDIQDTVTDSLQSIWMLIDREKLLLSESDLTLILNVLGQIVRWRKKTGLSNALRVFQEVIKKHPVLFSKELERSLLMGLQHILKETAMEEIEDFSNKLTLFERLTIRQEAASLAYELFVYYTTQKRAVPPVIDEWQNVCNSENEFAEIRTQWI